jgi:endonuclease G
MVGCGSQSTEKKETSVKSLTQEFTADCDEHYIFGLPASDEKSFLPICHQGYFIAFDSDKKIPRFTSHELTINESLFYVERDPNYTFEADPLLDESLQATQEDYKFSGFDRGHMQPWADSAVLYEALESNYYSNVTPQLAAFNRGIWLALENSIRSYVLNKGRDVYVITGAVEGTQSLGNGVEVPLAFYKVIFDLDSEVMSAYLIYQGDSNKALSEYVVSVDYLEKIVGLDFYPQMEKSIQDKLEAMSTGLND